jgi:hypothetical protein
MYRFDRVFTWFLLVIVLVGLLLIAVGPTESNSLLCPQDYTYIEAVDVCASNDYYSRDGMRVPLGMTAINEVLQEESARLPTAAEVDAIHAAADIKLRPKPFTRYDIMTRWSEFVRHDKYIDNQLAPYGDVTGQLIAGHKKDVIQPRRSGRVTIYGWHYQNGKPIQPVYSGHGYDYRDYSHGLRLIKEPNR